MLVAFGINFVACFAGEVASAEQHRVTEIQRTAH